MELELAGNAIVKNVNIRAEHHGEDRVLGVDLRIIHTTSLDALANFSPTLSAMLYDTSGKDGEPVLRMPFLKPLALDLKYENHLIRFGATGRQEFEGVKVHKIDVTAEQRGAVEIEMTVSLSNADAGDLPAFAELFLDETTEIEIEAMQAQLGLDEPED